MHRTLTRGIRSSPTDHPGSRKIVNEFVHDRFRRERVGSRCSLYPTGRADPFPYLRLAWAGVATLISVAHGTLNTMLPARY